MTTPEEICLDDIEIPSAQFTNTPVSLHGPVIITSDHHHKRQSIISRINGQRNKIFSRRLFYRKVLQDDNESGDSITEWERCDDFGSTPFIQQNSGIPNIQSTIYSSQWTIHSPKYCRDRCLMSDDDYEFDKDYYYEAILVNVSAASNVTIMSKSNVNTYGYIYENSFDPSDSSLNLLVEDDNSGDNEQFQLSAFLQPSTIYILVATTSYPYVMGTFSIIATGSHLASLTGTRGK
ncbi:unnamed protein product [Rotaria socialis]|uniref:Uncharacterized protein n=1 Tax=Rotaria socialis TaxID=392032 RepID=A0A818AIQ1_9BILA|nr:unnamed protein product [Rotaria socialis]CAF4801036.1 unnamed protein product [Rotaria socialis]